MGLSVSVTGLHLLWLEEATRLIWHQWLSWKWNTKKASGMPFNHAALLLQPCHARLCRCRNCPPLLQGMNVTACIQMHTLEMVGRSAKEKPYKRMIILRGIWQGLVPWLGLEDRNGRAFGVVSGSSFFEPVWSSLSLLGTVSLSFTCCKFWRNFQYMLCSAEKNILSCILFILLKS